MELMKPGGWDMVQLCRLLPKTGAIIPLVIQAGGQPPANTDSGGGHGTYFHQGY